MTNPIRLHSLVFLAFTVALAAPAQEGPPPASGQGPGRGRFFGPNIGFATLDTNADGVLDADEIAAAPKSLLKLDKNADGQLTSDEVRLAMPARTGRGGPGGGPEGRERGPENRNDNNTAEETVKTLMAFDANGDGKLAKAELPDRYQGLFDKGDQNKDGFLTPDEIRKMLAAQAPPPDNARTAGRGRPGAEGDGSRGGPDGGRPEARGNMNIIGFDPILHVIDTNGDGVISTDELRNAPASLKALDKDGDGKISREEAAPVRRGDGDRH